MTFIVCFISVGNAHATFEDGKYSVDKNLIFNVEIKEGDVIEIDYKAGSPYSVGRLYLKDLQNNIITSHSAGHRNPTTFSYTFLEDFEGVLVFTAGDRSIVNSIYEVRINGFTYFDGQGFIYGEVPIDDDFLKIENLKINKADLTYDHSYIPPEFQIKDIVLTFRENIIDGNQPMVALTGLKADTLYEVRAQVYFTNGHISNNLSLKFRTPEIINQGIVSVENVSWNSANLVINRNAINSQSPYQKINIYNSDNEKVGEIQNNAATYTLNELKAETEYIYYVEVVFDELNKSNRMAAKFTTLATRKEVSNLKAKATSESVSLTWKMPEYEELNFARIYRKSNDGGLITQMFSLFSSDSDDYSALFETNGTSFKDLTVASDSSYTYKVTTVSIDDFETSGTTIDITTEKVKVIGGGVQPGENGDYIITWESPTTGQIKVLVGGEEYVIVPASQGQVIIPGSDMVLNPLGNPDVTLIPITEEGGEGIPSTPGGGGLGSLPGGIDVGEILNGENLLQSGVALLAIVGAFLLLGLSFRVVPKLIYIVKYAFQQPSNNGGRQR